MSKYLSQKGRESLQENRRQVLKEIYSQYYFTKFIAMRKNRAWAGFSRQTMGSFRIDNQLKSICKRGDPIKINKRSLLQLKKLYQKSN